MHTLTSLQRPPISASYQLGARQKWMWISNKLAQFCIAGSSSLELFLIRKIKNSEGACSTNDTERNIIFSLRRRAYTNYFLFVLIIK